MKNEIAIHTSSDIQQRIFTIRDEQVMVDSDLAFFFGIKTKVLNQAVKRNIDRFPIEFMFRISKTEKEKLVTSCDHLANLKFSPTLPYVFTEQGVAMLSAVLKSETAVKMSIQIMSAFVAMKKYLLANAVLFQRIDNLELKLIETDKKLNQLFGAWQDQGILPTQGIFFDGQVFDAHKFVSQLIITAKKSIFLIDNYIDEYVLDLLSKKKKQVAVSILTKNISRALKLDEKKFNQQYGNLSIKEFNKSHDRFLIIDDKDIYHFGASLKDLGKKWFAFSKMEKTSVKSIINSITDLI